ncbi:hypothetical protein [Pseudanabaena sp. PCC 6802]|nr:hypothetical protein [Pseudanabaena sp. PCC 6802]
MVGRGLRPKLTGKAAILDRAGNCLRRSGLGQTRNTKGKGRAL